jgi:peptide/nickel transport system substrate-binding protein
MLLGTGAVMPEQIAAQTDRIVVAVGQWGTETPLAWRNTQLEKTLWDCVFDPLIMRDPKTFQHRPGLATEWRHINDFKTWIIKIRPGVMFHENWGELTSEDVKFTIEQHLKPDSAGGSAPFFRSQLEKIEIPNKYTIHLHFKSPVWEILAHLSQFVGYLNVMSKKYFETVGEEKASLHPIGSGPYRHVEGRQGDYHRFQAVENHWRRTPDFKELIIRRVADPGTRLSGLRTGEIDIAQVTGDYLEMAKRAGLRIHTSPDSACYWVVLSGQVLPDRDDYCPECPWVGDIKDPKSQEDAKKVRLAMNLAVNKQAIIKSLWRGTGSDTPFMFWYYPFNKGYSAEWKIQPYDPKRAKQLLAEAGYPNGFEIRANPVLNTFGLDAAEVMEAVALDWEKVGIKVKRVPEDWGNFIAKVKARKTGPAVWVYASPPHEEPSIAWQRTMWSKGAFHMAAEGPYDNDLEAIWREMNEEIRTKLTQSLATKMYHQHHAVMLGMKSTTWAVSKKVDQWDTLVGVPMETNYEYISAAK